MTCPVALETLDSMSVSTQEFLAQNGRYLTEVTMNTGIAVFLFQCFSVAVQCFTDKYKVL